MMTTVARPKRSPLKAIGENPARATLMTVKLTPQMAVAVSMSRSVLDSRAGRARSPARGGVRTNEVLRSGCSRRGAKIAKLH